VAGAQLAKWRELQLQWQVMKQPMHYTFHCISGALRKRNTSAQLAGSLILCLRLFWLAADANGEQDILPLWVSTPLEAISSLWGLQVQLDHFVNIVSKIRESVVAPALEVAVWICMVMSLMLVTEKLIMGAASLYAKVFRRRPQRHILLFSFYFLFHISKNVCVQLIFTLINM
jgi:hypothetical protein